MTRIGIAGIGGRMGREVLAAAQSEADFAVTGGLVRPGSRAAVASTLGANTPLHEDPANLLADVDVVVDFTNPDCSLSLARECALEGRPLVCGTTGLSAAQLAELQELSNRTAIVYSRNMSAGIAALLSTISELVRALDGFDVEIVEMHHRHKTDAPSGTALAIAETVASALDRFENDSLVFGRHGVSPRQQHHIGIHAVRGGAMPANTSSSSPGRVRNFGSAIALMDGGRLPSAPSARRGFWRNNRQASMRCAT